MVGNEINYVAESFKLGEFVGDGTYTKKCSNWLENSLGCPKVVLTHSCTAALEMAAILADIQPGDEIIMPSFTFVSTANAFVLRGGIPVFVDIRSDTLNINEELIEAAITKKTKAIVPMHYAGVSCEMDKIMEIAQRHSLLVIEDAAQGMMATYKGKPLGTIGDFGCYSFHKFKNIVSGEGGALTINNKSLIDRAEVIKHKGTNRSKFFEGQVDKYTWVDIGSSFLANENTAAFLWGQLQKAEFITQKRKAIWNVYLSNLLKKRINQFVQLPFVPKDIQHNGHIFYLVMASNKERSNFIAFMARHQIQCFFHYSALHNSSFGQIKGRLFGNMNNTNHIAESLVRLPLWIGMENEVEYISNKIQDFFIK